MSLLFVLKLLGIWFLIGVLGALLFGRVIGACQPHREDL